MKGINMEIDKLKVYSNILGRDDITEEMEKSLDIPNDELSNMIMFLTLNILPIESIRRLYRILSHLLTTYSIVVTKENNRLIMYRLVTYGY